MSLDAMKQALVALEHEARTGNDDAYRVERDALRAAIERAQPEQEPVAFDHGIGIDRFKVVRGAFWWHVLIGDSPTEHGKFRSRVSAEKMAADLLREFRNGAFVQHTAPRQWQGLTNEELWELWNSHTEQPFPEWFVDFKQAYKVIAEKLKEKNT